MEKVEEKLVKMMKRMRMKIWGWRIVSNAAKMPGMGIFAIIVDSKKFEFYVCSQESRDWKVLWNVSYGWTYNLVG